MAKAVAATAKPSCSFVLSSCGIASSLVVYILVCARELQQTPGQYVALTVVPSFGSTFVLLASVAAIATVLLLGRLLSAGQPLAAVGAWWRAVHLRRLEQNSRVCVQIQRLRNPVTDTVFRTAGFFAEEDFYMIVAPLLFWVVPSYTPFCFHLITVTTFGLLVGDSLKDILYVPRPSHPHLWKYSHSQGTRLEHGMPSTHAMNAVSNSFMWLLCKQGKCGISNSDIIAIDDSTAVAVAITWILSICASRLYLGVHTLDDVVVGCVIGLMVIRIWLACHEFVETWLDTAGPECPILIVGVAFVTLEFTRAVPPAWTPSRRQSANLTGLLSGLLCTVWYIGRTPIPKLRSVLSSGVQGSLWLAVVRVAVGFAICLGGELAVKKLATKFFSRVLREPKGYVSVTIHCIYVVRKAIPTGPGF